MNNDIYIIGAGGLGREVASIMNNIQNQFPFKLKGFIDDGLTIGTSVNGITVMGGIDMLSAKQITHVFLAIGNPTIRKNIMDKIHHLPLNFPNLIHRSATLEDMSTIEIGKGIFVGPGVILTTNIHLSDFSFIHSGTILHHDTYVGDNCVLMPGVRITSKCKIGSHSFVGTGSVIANEVELPAFSYVPAGTIFSGELSSVKTSTHH